MERRAHVPAGGPKEKKPKGTRRHGNFVYKARVSEVAEARECITTFGFCMQTGVYLTGKIREK
jgi:hypothetical protein